MIPDLIKLLETYLNVDDACIIYCEDVKWKLNAFFLENTFRYLTIYSAFFYIFEIFICWCFLYV